MEGRCLAIANELKEYKNLIKGEKVGASSGNTMESIDPATGKAWAKIPLSTIEDVETAVASAREAFPGWSKLAARERGNYLRRVGDLIQKHANELAMLETRGNGWVIRETSYGLIPILASYWYDAAGAASLVGSLGKTVQMGQRSFGYTLREPIGVVVGILPWNAPLFTFTIKAAYALAAGNTVIIKPSEHASVSSLRYAELLAEILPPGVINVISGLGTEIGDSLVSHKKISKVSLTGSIGTARAITRATAQTPKPLVFELGGKSPNIVFADADLDKAVDGVTTNAIFTGNSGQICVAGSRILIQRPIFEEMVTRMKEKMSSMDTVKFGSTLDPTTTMGPVSNLQQFKKVCSFIDLGLKEGELIFGGRYGGNVLLPEQLEFSGGYWVEPTLFKVNNNSLRLCQEEIFGPVAVVMPFDTEEEALAIANDTGYGLGAGVWTSDIAKAHRMVRSIESGNVWVNTYRMVGVDLPFGGVKESGYGTDSILDYTIEKTCVIDIG
ncbi:aldehyde dehydrogenase family protein [Neobacillus vireti]|uniref:aldehyde dehydrogenase family protein n=1 Tax=Neobacillus vireti TaxID=220686 RepID=UPI002FFF4422